MCDPLEHQLVFQFDHHFSFSFSFSLDLCYTQTRSPPVPFAFHTLSSSGDPNIRYFHSHWALQPGEALVIEATPPECATWNFQLNNYWMESLDYRYHPIHVNKGTAKYKKDGSIRIVVAAERPAQLDQNTYDPNPTQPNSDGPSSFLRVVWACRWARAVRVVAV